MVATAPRTDEIKYLERKISRWLGSQYRKDQIDGERYYLGFHDILFKEREVIGEDGKLVKVNNLPNERIVDNIFAQMIDVKNNYLLSQEPVFVSENEGFQKELDKLITFKFLRKLKNVGEKSLTHGIAWVYPYYDEQGEFKFKVFDGHSILPFWTSDEHDELEMAVRYYEEENKNSITDEIIKRIEVYDKNGIQNYILVGNILMVDKDNPHTEYITKGDEVFTWENRIPLIPFRYDNKELPLIKRCKSLQDAINTLTSTFCNCMQEDIRNTILVLQNYDGTDLKEFREMLMRYGAIKIRSESGAAGDVKTLRIDVDSNNYNVVLSLLRQALIQNCKGYDNNNIKMDGSPNSLQMRGAYQLLDMHANSAIVEFSCALDQLLWFVKAHLKSTGQGDYFDEKVKIIFNKDLLVNEAEILTTLTNAGVRIPNELMLEQIPWINDAKKAQQMIEEEDRKMMDQLDPYAKVGQGGKGTSSNKKKVSVNSAETRLMGGNQ